MRFLESNCPLLQFSQFWGVFVNLLVNSDIRCVALSWFYQNSGMRQNFLENFVSFHCFDVVISVVLLGHFSYLTWSTQLSDLVISVVFS
jgi:hypothetical protein